MINPSSTSSDPEESKINSEIGRYAVIDGQ